MRIVSPTAGCAAEQLAVDLAPDERDAPPLLDVLIVQEAALPRRGLLGAHLAVDRVDAADAVHRLAIAVGHRQPLEELRARRADQRQRLERLRRRPPAAGRAGRRARRRPACWSAPARSPRRRCRRRCGSRPRPRRGSRCRRPAASPPRRCPRRCRASTARRGTRCASARATASPSDLAIDRKTHVDQVSRSAALRSAAAAPRGGRAASTVTTPTATSAPSASSAGLPGHDHPGEADRQRRQRVHGQAQRAGDDQAGQAARSSSARSPRGRTAARSPAVVAPSALRTPISRVRSLTAMSMMFITPMPPSASVTTPTSVKNCRM